MGFSLRGGRRCIFATAVKDGIEESDEQYYVVVLSLFQVVFLITVAQGNDKD